jgi:hypothetical protein
MPFDPITGQPVPGAPGSADVSSTIAAIRACIAQASAPLEKATGTFVQPSTATTGLQQYNLEPAAKNLYPVYSPIRNELPRDKATGGIQANWKAVTGISNGGTSFGVGEGNRGGLMQVSTADYFAMFKTLGRESSVTKEAELSAEGFDDLRARSVRSLLEQNMIDEEKVILGGNSSYALGRTPKPTLAAVAGGGSLAASTTYSVICVALTFEGLTFANLTTGPQWMTTRVNTDGSTDTYGGGAAQPSLNTTITTGSAGASITASVAAVQGACGYAWYFGLVGNEQIVAITTVSTVSITATAAQSAPTIPTANLVVDASIDALIHDGYLTMNAKTPNSKWIGMTPGATLTPDGLGGVNEIETVLEWYWDTLRMSPDMMIMNSRDALTLRRLFLAAGTSQPSRMIFNISQNQIVGGGMPKGYLNMFAQGTGPSEVAIMIHPYMPQGTILFRPKKLPYPMNNVPQLERILCRQDYYQYQWPERSRKTEYGLYTDQVFQHYFPVSLAVISNITPS